MSKLKNMLVALLCVACVGVGSAFAACDNTGDNSSSSSSSATSTTDSSSTESSSPAAEDATVSSVKISGDTSVAAGSTITLKATVTMSDSSTYSGTITWTSSDTSVATVSGGTVTGVKAGTATITATAGEKSDTYSITVTEATATGEAHTSTFSYSELTTATGGADKTALKQEYFTGNNSFLYLNFERSTNQYRSSNSCFEIKGEGLAVAFLGTGTISVGFASTGSGNTSSFALKDTSGNYLAATSFTGTTSADNKYSVSGTSVVTVTYTISTAGTYILCTNVNSDGRGARISAISMADNYEEGTTAPTFTAGTDSADCKNAGTLSYTASISAYSYTVNTTEKGHTEGSQTVTTAATCTTEGAYSIYCTECNEELETGKLDALGHSYTYEVTTIPTSSTVGQATLNCSNDSSHTQTVELPVLGSIDYTMTTDGVTTSGNSIYTYTVSNLENSDDVEISFEATTVTQAAYVTAGSDITVFIGNTSTDITSSFTTNQALNGFTFTTSNTTLTAAYDDTAQAIILTLNSGITAGSYTVTATLTSDTSVTATLNVTVSNSLQVVNFVVDNITNLTTAITTNSNKEITTAGTYYFTSTAVTTATAGDAIITYTTSTTNDKISSSGIDVDSDNSNDYSYYIMTNGATSANNGRYFTIDLSAYAGYSYSVEVICTSKASVLFSENNECSSTSDAIQYKTSASSSDYTILDLTATGTISSTGLYYITGNGAIRVYAIYVTVSAATGS